MLATDAESIRNRLEKIRQTSIQNDNVNEEHSNTSNNNNNNDNNQNSVSSLNDNNTSTSAQLLNEENKNKEMKTTFNNEVSSSDASNVSKQKFSNFLQKANDMFQNYEKQISLYKKKLSFYDSKDLSRIREHTDFELAPSKKELFFHTIKKRTADETVTLQAIQNEYNNKIIELFAENENLQKMIDKISYEVINKYTHQIQLLGERIEEERTDKIAAQAKLKSVDNIFIQNEQMKEELQEKSSEIDELNEQQIRYMSKIENLTLQIKGLDSQLKYNLDYIDVKEKEIKNYLSTIENLNKEIENKITIINNKDSDINEKDLTIKTLYTDNLSWEEKYKLQSQEIENYKKWTLWDLNTTEAFKKIDTLESELRTTVDGYTKTKNDYTQLKDKFGKVSNALIQLNEKNKHLLNENEVLKAIKIEHDKMKIQLEDYLQIKNEYTVLKKEHTVAVDKYESEIISQQKTHEQKLSEIKQIQQIKIEEIVTSYEHQMEELKLNHQEEIKKTINEYQLKLDNNNLTHAKKQTEERELYESDMTKKINLIAEKDEIISTLKATNNELSSSLDKKAQMVTNLKDLYDNTLNKLQLQEQTIKTLTEQIENNVSVSNNNTNINNTTTNVTSNPEQNETKVENHVNTNNNTNNETTTGAPRISADLSNGTFIQSLLIDYLYLLTLFESSISFQTLITELRENVHMYNTCCFTTNNTNTNSYYSSLNCLQTELMEDIYFTAFDMLMNKKIVNNSDMKNLGKKVFKVNFEDFDLDTINNICNKILSNNFISRLINPSNETPPKTVNQLSQLLITKYEKAFDFGKMNFPQFITDDIVPSVAKKIEKDTNRLQEDVQTLVQLSLNNFKNGKIIINERELYSFEKYYDEYYNITNMKNRDNSLEVSKKFTHSQHVDNINHNIKYYRPKELSFQKCFDSKDELNSLNRISINILLNLPQILTSLTLSTNALTGPKFNNIVLPMISCLKKLTVLNLSPNDLEDDDIKPLMEYIKCNKTVQYLNLSQNNLTSSTGFYLNDALKKNKTLEILHIGNNEINESGFISFINTLAQNTTSILELNIGFNNLQKEDLKVISDYLSNNPPLQILDLSGNRIDGLSSNILGVSFKKAKQLKVIKANSTDLTEDSCPQFLRYLNETNIEDIELNMNSFANTGQIMVLGKIKTSVKVRNVSLKRCDLDAMALDFIVTNLTVSQNLRTLNLEWNMFDGVVFEKFCKDMASSNCELVVIFSKGMVPKNSPALLKGNKNIKII